MANKLSDFLTTNKIDPRRVLTVSRELERLRPEDRALKLARARKAASADAAPQDGPVLAKPRSGKPVTRLLLERAASGRPVSGPGKSRILRAVNRVLEQKKKEPVDLRALF